MKELNLYECEICGTRFKAKIDCYTCEKSHILPKKITRSKFHRCNDDNYPDYIEVEMVDGKVVRYTR